VDEEVSLYFLAVSALTVTESLSSAGEDFSSVSFLSSLALTASFTASVDFCPALGSR
jgi:hypothetical protein